MFTVDKTVETYWIKLYVAGPIDVAKQVIRGECMREGLCVTVEPTDFIYTGGEEAGYVVGLLNYPRFPCSPEQLWTRATHLANLLVAATHQHSILLMGPDKTQWLSRRAQ